MMRRNNGEKQAKLISGIVLIVFGIFFCGIVFGMSNSRMDAVNEIYSDEIVADIEGGEIVIEHFDSVYIGQDNFGIDSGANKGINFVFILFGLVGAAICISGFVLVVSAVKNKNNVYAEPQFNNVNMNTYYNNSMNPNSVYPESNTYNLNGQVIEKKNNSLDL